MTSTKELVEAFPKGIVVLHEWLVGPGGAERLAVEEFLRFSALGIPTRLLAFGASPRGLFGLDPSQVEIIPRTNVLDGVVRLRRRLRELDPDLIVTASGLRDLYLATLFTDHRYLLHQHEAPYKIICQYRLRLLPSLRRAASRQIRETAWGYRHIPVPDPGVSLLGRLQLEAYSILDALAVRRASAITSLSHRAAREVPLLVGREASAVWGCFRSEILKYQPSGSLARKLGADGKKILLSISRLDVMKRLDEILRAFARIAPERPDTILAIGGTGPEEGSLRTLAADLGLADRVRFLGFVPDEELWDDIASADVFLCADWTDFDIAPYEALALGRRVVWTSEIETDPWLVERGAVFVADPTAEALAPAMVRALDAPDVPRGELVRFLEAFTWENYCRRVLEIAKSAAAPRA